MQWGVGGSVGPVCLEHHLCEHASTVRRLLLRRKRNGFWKGKKIGNQVFFFSEACTYIAEVVIKLKCLKCFRVRILCCLGLQAAPRMLPQIATQQSGSPPAGYCLRTSQAFGEGNSTSECTEDRQCMSFP